MKSHILVIYTGGTIGMKKDPTSGALTPYDFGEIYDEFPSLRALQVKIEVVTLAPIIDSSNMNTTMWGRLAAQIESEYNNYDGFVVLHGTDTMSYTASALSFMLQNLSKPVVFTGSQIPISILRTDGLENLITAIEIAAAKREDGTPEVCEVSLYFQNRLFRANRTSKRSAEALNAFRSYNHPALAEVGVNISYNRHAMAPRMTAEPLNVSYNMSENIIILKLHPCMNSATVKAMVNCPNLEAVVMESYGSGNAPTSEWFLEIIQDLISRGVVVLNITQCSDGEVEMSLYQTGQSLQKIGVLCGYDMTCEAAVAKLSYVMGLPNLSYAERVDLLKKPIRGEFTLKNGCTD